MIRPINTSYNTTPQTSFGAKLQIPKTTQVFIVENMQENNEGFSLRALSELKRIFEQRTELTEGTFTCKLTPKGDNVVFDFISTETKGGKTQPIPLEELECFHFSNKNNNRKILPEELKIFDSLSLEELKKQFSHINFKPMSLKEVEKGLFDIFNNTLQEVAGKFLLMSHAKKLLAKTWNPMLSNNTTHTLERGNNQAADILYQNLTEPLKSLKGTLKNQELQKRAQILFEALDLLGETPFLESRISSIVSRLEDLLAGKIQPQYFSSHTSKKP